MKVDIINKQSDLIISRTSAKRLVEAMITYEGFSPEEVALHFVSPKKICSLHLQFFDDPALTDCISFPLDDLMLGDVFVCPRVALNYAAAHGKDAYQELTLYVVHGLLHLMGYDDLEKKEKAKMRRAEKRHLCHIEKQGLWLRL